MHGPCLPPNMEEEESKPLKITTLNFQNIESNMQYINKLLKSSDFLCLQETWLFKFQLRQLSEIHKSFDGFGKAVDDDNPLPPSQKPRGYGGVATLFRKDMDIRVRKCLDGGCRVIVTELVTDLPICIINVYMPCRNSRTSDDFDAILLEVQEILDKYAGSHVVILLGDMNSSLVNRVNNDQDKELSKFCYSNKLISLQRGIPMFFHVNEKDSAEIDHIFLNEKAKVLSSTVRVETYTDSNVSDHIPVYIILKIRTAKKNLKHEQLNSSPNGKSVTKQLTKNLSQNNWIPSTLLNLTWSS